MTLAYDFYSPFMAAAIQTDPEEPDTRFPLWVNINDDQRKRIQSGGGGDLSALSFCTDITVEIQLAKLPKISATLCPPYRDGMNFLNSHLIEWANSTLEVQFGYSAGAPEGPVLGPVFSGTLLKPEVTIGQDIQIVLNAQGVGSFSASRLPTHRNFVGHTREEIITQLAQGLGKIKRDLVPDVTELKYGNNVAAFSETITQAGAREAARSAHDQTYAVAFQRWQRYATYKRAQARAEEEAAAAAKDAEASYLANAPGAEARAQGALAQATYKKMCEERINFSAAGLTDWMAIWVLVRECGCWMMQVGKVLRIFSQESRITAAPRWKYVLYDYPQGIIGPKEGVFPILSASSPTGAVYMHGVTKGMVLQGIDSKTAQAWKDIAGEQKGQTPRTSGEGDAKAPDTKGNPDGPTTVQQTPEQATISKGESEPTSAGSSSGDPSGEAGNNPFASGGEEQTPAMAAAQAEYSGLQQLMGIQLEVESLMNPELLPGELIEVHGLGQRLDANYCVFTHAVSCGQGGFSSRMNCVSNTGKLGTAFADIVSPTNQSKPASSLDIATRDLGAAGDLVRGVTAKVSGTLDSIGSGLDKFRGKK